jgi:hypothetical protein
MGSRCFPARTQVTDDHSSPDCYCWGNGHGQAPVGKFGPPPDGPGGKSPLALDSSFGLDGQPAVQKRPTLWPPPSSSTVIPLMPCSGLAEQPVTTPPHPFLLLLLLLVLRVTPTFKSHPHTHFGRCHQAHLLIFNNSTTTTPPTTFITQKLPFNRQHGS